MIDLSEFTHLKRLVDAIIAVFPGHLALATKSFADRSPAILKLSDQLSELILKIAETDNGLDQLASDYRFLCEDIVPPEELYFRRNGNYRLSKFEDAFKTVYADTVYMKRYMNGLLVSDVMWNNHIHAVNYYVNTYLPSLPLGANHLEIGPGHGLFLYFAALEKGLSAVTGWDVSATSIDTTRHALTTLGVNRPFELKLQNLFEGPTEGTSDGYDSVVLSEILEHLEDPVAALKAVKLWMRPGGRVWVNVPSNSPAPDHLFLFNSPEHACEIVQQAGFDIEDSAAFPMTGTTLEKARKWKLAITCLVTGRVAS